MNNLERYLYAKFTLNSYVSPVTRLVTVAFVFASTFRTASGTPCRSTLIADSEANLNLTKLCIT